MSKKIKLSIMVVFVTLCILAAVFTVSAATWYVYNSSYVNRTASSIIRGVAVNQSGGTVKSFWVTDTAEDMVYLYTPQFVHVSNFTTSNVGSSYPTSVFTNISQGEGSNTSIFFVDQLDAVIYHVNGSGDSIQNITPAYPCNDYTTGITSNDTSRPISDFWVTDTGYDTVCHINASGSVLDSFSTVGFGSLIPGGIATNSTENDTKHFFITDAQDDMIYHVTGSGVLIESINLASLGITQPHGLAISDVNATVSNLYVTSRANNKLYWLKTEAVALPPHMLEGTQNLTLVKEAFVNNLSVEVWDDAGVDTCYLMTNESGTMENMTAGKYDSPQTLNLGAGVHQQVDFIWDNIMTGTAAGRINVRWNITCNNTLDLWNRTVGSGFEANLTTAQCFGILVNISEMNVTDMNNITINFTGTGYANCTFYLPFFPGYTNYTGCNYGATYAESVRVQNLTDGCLVNVSTVNLSVGDLMRIDKREEVKAVPPPSVPIAIASGLVGVFLIFYTIKQIKKSAGWK